jgi:hypothetical protein
VTENGHLISKVFGFLPHTEKIEARPKLKVVGGCFWAHMYAYSEFLKKI